MYYAVTVCSSIAVSVTDLQQQYNLTSENLDKKCSTEHLLEIYSFVSWKDVGPRLCGIDITDITDIDRDENDEQDKRRKLLNLWVERNGSDATYRAIITAMLEAKKRDEAEKICVLIS